jgi:hypothetical protein
MNEIKVVIVGLIALIIVALSLWVLDEPKIIQDKDRDNNSVRSRIIDISFR